MIITTPAAFAAALKAGVAALALVGAFPPLAVGVNPAPVAIDASQATITAMTMYGSRHVTLTGGVISPSPTNRGVWFDLLIAGADDISVSYVTFPSAHDASISISNSTHLKIFRNTMRDSEGDCLDLAGSQYFSVEYNTCTGHAAGSPGLHPDGFAIWSAAVNPLQTAHGLIANNFVIGNFQGVTAFDHPTLGMKGFTDITIDSNYAATDEPQCFALYDATASRVTNNRCSTLLGAKWQARVNVLDAPVAPGAAPSGNVVSGNVDGVKP